MNDLSPSQVISSNNQSIIAQDYIENISMETYHETEDFRPFDSLHTEQIVQLKETHLTQVRSLQDTVSQLQLENELLQARLQDKEKILDELNRKLLEHRCFSNVPRSSSIPVLKCTPSPPSKSPQTTKRTFTLTKSTSHTCVNQVNQKNNSKPSASNPRSNSTNFSSSLELLSSCKPGEPCKRLEQSKSVAKLEKSKFPVVNSNITSTLCANCSTHVHCELLRNTLSEIASCIVGEVRPSDQMSNSLQKDLQLLKQTHQDSLSKPITHEYLLPKLCAATLSCVRAAFRSSRAQIDRLSQAERDAREQIKLQKQLLNKTGEERKRIVRIQTDITQQYRALRRLPAGSTPSEGCISQMRESLQAQISALAGESAKMLHLHEEYCAQKAKSSAQLADAQEKLKLQKEELQKLQKLYADALEEARAARKEVACAKEAQALAAQRMAEYADQRRLLATQMGKCEVQCEQSRNALVEKQQLLTKVETRAVKAETGERAAIDETRRLSRLLEQLQEEAKRGEQQLAQALEQVQKLQASCDEAATKLNAANQKLHNCTVERDAARALAQEHLTSVHRISDMLQKAGELANINDLDKSGFKSVLDAKIKPERLQLEQAVENVRQCALRVQKLVNDNRMLTERLENVQAQCKRQASSFGEEAANATRKCAELLSTLSDQRAQLDRLREEKTGTSAKCMQLEQCMFEFLSTFQQLWVEIAQPDQSVEELITATKRIPLQKRNFFNEKDRSSRLDTNGLELMIRSASRSTSDTSGIEEWPLLQQLSKSIHQVEHIIHAWRLLKKREEQNNKELNQIRSILDQLKNEKKLWEKSENDSKDMIGQMEQLKTQVETLRTARGNLQQALHDERLNMQQLRSDNKRLIMELKQSQASVALATTKWRQCEQRAEKEDYRLSSNENALFQSRHDLAILNDHMRQLRNENQRMNAEINADIALQRRCSISCICVCHAPPLQA